VLTINVDSSTEHLKHSGELFLRLQHLLQSLPRLSLLEMVQIGPWETVTPGRGINTSAFKLLDIVLSDQQRFSHFKRLLLGFSAYLNAPPVEDVRALGSLLPRLRDADKLFVVNSDDAMLIPSVADRLIEKY
jgi:hypothetical protein